MQNKKNLLIVTHHLTIGGVQKSLINALNAINYDNYQVTLYLRRNRTDILPFVNKNVSVLINEDQTHYYRKPYALLLEIMIHLCRFLRMKPEEQMYLKRQNEYIIAAQMEHERKTYFSDKEYDIAISYVQGYEALFVSKYINADRKIMFYHGSTDELHELHEACFEKYDAIVGVNAAVRDVLRDLYPAHRDRITYLTNFVDADEVIKKSLAFPVKVPSGTVLCTCGRFAAVKGFDLALEAAAILHNSGCCFKWFFVGDGPEREKLEDMISHYQLQDCIEITGMQDNPYPWINACDIYIQPSREEAHSLTIVEAQILCKPVVTTSTVGGKQLVRNGITGYICDIDSNALAEAIMNLMNSVDLRKNMMTELKKYNRSGDFTKYREGWKRLLEG